MKTLKILGLVFCMCIAMVACQRELTRRHAAKILKKEFGQSGLVYQFLIGRQDIPENIWGWNLNAIKALNEAGLINFRYVRKSKYGRTNHIVVVESLTEKGMKYFVRFAHDVPEYPLVRLADKTLVRITGILSDAHSAHVEYEYRYTNITPFGRILVEHGRGSDRAKIPEGIKKSEEDFSRYDDGWRIN